MMNGTELYDEWYRKGEFEYTKGEVVKPPNYVLQIQWIVDVGTKIGFETIKKSFETCGIPSPPSTHPSKKKCGFYSRAVFN